MGVSLLSGWIWGIGLIAISLLLFYLKHAISWFNNDWVDLLALLTFLFGWAVISHMLMSISPTMYWIVFFFNLTISAFLVGNFLVFSLFMGGITSSLLIWFITWWIITMAFSGPVGYLAFPQEYNTADKIVQYVNNTHPQIVAINDSGTATISVQVLQTDKKYDTYYVKLFYPDKRMGITKQVWCKIDKKKPIQISSTVKSVQLTTTQAIVAVTDCHTTGKTTTLLWLAKIGYLLMIVLILVGEYTYIIKSINNK